MNNLFKKIIGAASVLALSAGAFALLGIHHEAKNVNAADANFTLTSADETTVNGVTASFAKGSGSNAPAWYAAGLRLYANNTVTISSSNNITAISFNWEKQGNKTFATLTADSGTYTHPTNTGVGSWSGSATSVVFTLGGSGQLQLNTFSVTYGGSAPTMTGIAIDVSDAETQYYVGDNASFSGISVTATYDDSSTSDVTSQATISANPSVIAAATTSIEYTATLGDFSDSDSVNISILTPHAGTEADPFTVTDAIKQCKSNGTTAGGPWVTKGIISKVKNWDSRYTNIDFWISEDGTGESDTTKTVQAFRCKYVGNTDVTSDNYKNIALGKEVVITGNLLNYQNTTPEYAQGCYLLSLGEPGLKEMTIKNASSEAGPYALTIGDSLDLYTYEGTTEVTSTWEVSDETICSIDSSSGHASLTALKSGVVTITAKKEGYNDAVASVTCSKHYDHAGTAEDPFTVAEAIEKANEIGAVGSSGQGPWVTKGIISRVTSAPAATYWNATYYISDDGGTTAEVQVYRGFYINNVKFDETTAALLKAGKIVTVTGNLTLFNNEPEYCQGNYMLSLEDPSTGDIDVTFEPAENLEVGDTGTLVASTTASNPQYTFSVDNESIFDLDYTTGEYEVLDVGVVEVTVSVTSDDGNGEAKARITLNGSFSDMKSVADANTIASGVPSGKTTDCYYYFEGYVKTFNSDGQSRALIISSFNEADTIILFVGKADYSTFISGLNLGDCIRIKAHVQNYNGTYELTSPVKVFSEYISLSFCYELLNLTDAVCHDYDDVTDNKDALEPIWETLSPKYSTLNDVQQKVLVNPDTYGAGDTIKNAMARYDYLVDKYDLDNFIIGRTPSGLNNTTTVVEQKDETTFMIIVTVVGLISLTAISTLLIAKRRKDY